MTRKFYMVTFLLLGLYPISFGQCLCASIRFQIKVTDLHIVNDSANYSIRVTNSTRFGHQSQIRNEQKLQKNEITGDTINLSFRTGGGIDTLTFVLKNLSSNEEMNITIIDLGYDIPYFIDLLQFTKGSYYFDWTEITNCLSINNRQEIIVCGKQKFSIIPNPHYALAIKPVDLKYFRTKE